MQLLKSEAFNSGFTKLDGEPDIAMTGFALLQLNEMRHEVGFIDKDLVERQIAWIESQKAEGDQGAF